TATRLLLLGVVAHGRVDPLPAGWVEQLGHALAHPDPAVRREALAAVRTRNVSRFDRELAELSRQPSLPAELRIAALECLAGRRHPLDAKGFALLSGHLSETTEPLLRLAAARTLGAAALTHDQLTRLARSLRGVSTIVLRSLLPAFAGSG